MCGIFGYIGHKQNAADIVFEGLKLLDYRGYDSWGVAVKIGDKIEIEKKTGKIGDNKISLPKSTLGIGHTRWATHGGVTTINAHPHKDCSGEIAVLHNGIIENFQELKNDLLKKGHKFISETDTEVFAHLVEDFLKKEDLVNSVKDAFNLLRGLSAIVVINTKSNKIIVAKNGSPIVIGKGKNEFFIASDTAGILPYTKEILFLKDNELISLSDTLDLYSLPKLKPLAPVFETINWKIEQAQKGQYKHFMLKEITEQPTIIKNIATSYADQISDLADVIKESRGVFFIGSGTASHACLAGVYLFSKIAKKHVNTSVASEFNYLEDFLNKESLIIPLSQSGETIDIIEPLTRARNKGSKIMALVNVLGSTIYRMADYKLLLGAGPEKAVASTKAYTAKISVLTMLAFTLVDKMENAREILLKSAEEVERLLSSDNLEKIEKIAQKLHKQEHMYVMGRGMSYATALEGALKIKEVSYMHAEGLAGGEIKHGPIALIDNGTPCIVLAPADETFDAIMSNAIEIKSRGGYIIGVSSKNSPAFDEWIEVKETGMPLLTQVVPMQLLGYYLAIAKKLDPDKPRNLAKSVTVK
jgi:glucosamine--fructose-6-phosphate aminotransferase (isomerizing)